MNVDLKFQEEMKKKQRPLKSPKVNVQCIQFMYALLLYILTNHFNGPCTAIGLVCLHLCLENNFWNEWRLTYITGKLIHLDHI